MKQNDGFFEAIGMLTVFYSVMFALVGTGLWYYLATAASLCFAAGVVLGAVVCGASALYQKVTKC